MNEIALGLEYTGSHLTKCGIGLLVSWLKHSENFHNFPEAVT